MHEELTTLDAHGDELLGDGTKRGARSLRNSRELDGRLGDAVTMISACTDAATRGTGRRRSCARGSPAPGRCAPGPGMRGLETDGLRLPRAEEQQRPPAVEDDDAGHDLAVRRL